MKKKTLILRDAECIAFLQWALPQLHMRWSGFRKVRGQVCKRLKRRLVSLGMHNLDDYRQYLNTCPQEWQCLDQLCRVTVSRFNRDRVVFQKLATKLLPNLINTELQNAGQSLRVWSAGCASGEEPYTVTLYWYFQLASKYPGVALDVLGTDIDTRLLERARLACYEYGAIKRLPESWRKKAFYVKDGQYCLDKQYQKHVHFRLHDLRSPLEADPFHLILCRNLAFTYYDDDLRRQVLASLCRHLCKGGILVVGAHETIGERNSCLSPCSKTLGIYQKTEYTD